MIMFAEPTVQDLTDALSDAIPMARKVVPSEFHAKVSLSVSFFRDSFTRYVFCTSTLTYRLSVFFFFNSQSS